MRVNRATHHGAKGDSRAAREKDHRAAERVLRRGLRRSQNCARFGSASPGASYFQIAAVALPDMAPLCSALSVSRPRLDQSPPSHALCHRGHGSSHVVQLRASVFSVSASTLHRLDGRERISSAAGCLLCRGLLPGERSEEHTSELQSLRHLVCRLLLEKKKKTNARHFRANVYIASP